MKLAITRFVIVAAIAVLMVAVGSTAAWAQTPPCPSSPSYNPDFTGATITIPSIPGCLTANNNGDTGYPGLFAPAYSLTQPPGTPNPAQPAPADVTKVLRVTPDSGGVAGSVWYNTQQSVATAFSTTFTFQLSGADVTAYGPADGFAFVIQASGTSALGPNGCGMGFAQGSCSIGPPAGISKSLAVAFKTYNDGDSFNNANSVLINSNGTGANCIGDSCTIAYNNSLPNAPNSEIPINLSDGGVHTVTISYTLTQPLATGSCLSNPCLDVVLDGNDLFNGGVPLTIPNTSPVSLSTLIGSNTAYVGFTGGTGGGDDNQDILSWTFTPQQVQGAPVTPTTLVQTASVTIAGNPVTATFDFSNVPPSNLMVQTGTIPYFGFSGLTQPQYTALVAGTALGGTTCLLAQGLFDSNNDPLCEVNTFTATSTANPTQSGANLPQSNTSQYIRDIVFTQTFNLNPDQSSPVNGAGLLMIPTGTAPGVAEFNDSVTCPYPMGDPLYGQVCPRSIMTSVVDGPTKPSGTPKPAGSSQVFFCCEPEWATVPTVATDTFPVGQPLWTAWTNISSSSIPVSFISNPPPQNPSGGFQAAQGLGVSFGAVAKGVVLDPVLSFPTEQTAITSTACPGTWALQVPVSYNVTGSLTQYDNSGNGTAFTEGAYSLLYAPLDCDEFLGLAYPTSIDLTGAGTSPNLASWNTAPFGVDLTNPTVGPITLSPAAPGSYYAVGATVNASMTCTDPLGHGVASGIASCGGTSVTPSNGTGPGSFTASASVPTGTTGLHSFNFTAGAT
ncbi:MAG: L-type lectin-domain containing protein, partial [Candidatus Sulfotelmatobacter sp.]